ncbi:MAG TPA: hypothetical protein VEJ63_05155 [Planctomycetota bacterium]|nr:hypothetical protein [Planctomycetota bacterium]
MLFLLTLTTPYTQQGCEVVVEHFGWPYAHSSRATTYVSVSWTLDHPWNLAWDILICVALVGAALVVTEWPLRTRRLKVEWLRIHLFTALVLMIEAGILLRATILCIEERVITIEGATYYYDDGWPFPTTVVFPNLVGGTWALGWNIAANLAILGATAFLCELLIARPRAKS